MQLVFVHGWGFSPDIWNPIRNALNRHDHFMVDFGYFDKPATTIQELPPNAVCIGHSLGVQWLLSNAAHKMAGLVSISGFDCFSNHIPMQTISLMKHGLRKNPAVQLSLFHRQCGLKQARNSKPLQLDNLSSGLDNLASHDCPSLKEPLSVPVSVLASRNDAIVSSDMTEKIWDGYNIIWSEGGAHTLPLERPQWCAGHILELLSQIQAPE